MISGKPAYGWRCIEPGSTILEEDPAEQEAIRQARLMRAHGLSLRGIANTLAEAGYLGRTGKTLSASTIQTMIADDAPLNMRMGKTFCAIILDAVRD